MPFIFAHSQACLFGISFVRYKSYQYLMSPRRLLPVGSLFAKYPLHKEVQIQFRFAARY